MTPALTSSTDSAASAYGDDSLLKHEYPLLRAAAQGADAVRAAVRALLFPPGETGATPPELSGEEADEAVEALAAYLSAEADALERDEAEALRPRRDASYERLLEDAEAAVASGLRSAGRSQREDYRDALVILRGITDSPQGRRDYAVWFRTGWLLWQTDAPAGECEEAFYQAARLSRATPGAYFGLTSRHVAAMQHALGRAEEAAATLDTALEVLPDDPLLLWDAARAASALGKSERAVAFVGRCVSALAPLTVLLFRDPVLETERAAVAEMLRRRRDAARARAQTATERWRRALELVRRAEAAGEVSLPVPAELTEDAIEAAAGDEETERGGKAAEVLAAARAALERAIEDARAAETRYRKHIDQLHRDKETWEKSLVALKAEADAMGMSLEHPPSPKGILRKKNPQHERVFVNFHSCRGNLAKVNVELRDALPQIRANLAQATRRRELLEKTAASLREDGAPLV